MRILERFDKPTLDWITEVMDTEPGITRNRLTRMVCERLEWRAPNGSYQVTSCALGLRRLENHGYFRLPRPTRNVRKEPLPPIQAQFTRPALNCSLDELGEIRLYTATGDKWRNFLWRWLMDSWHPLGAGALCGARICYLIESAGNGILGAISFSSAAWRLAARDRWIGWADETRSERLPMVVNNSRFLILPQVSVPNLASHVLALASRQVVQDWETMYGVAPALLETFVDPQRHRGTCYQAANWLHIGRTSGRGRQDDRDEPAPKKLFVLPLRRDFREVLGGSEPLPPPALDWSEVEFGRTELGDKRLHKRLFRLARELYTQPLSTLPAACGGKAAIKAAYRFFSHPKVKMDSILQGHYAATADRIGKHPGVVLAVQDTTTVNYHAHKATQGLGPIDAHGTRGILIHDTMAFTAEGLPLGLIDVQHWIRTEKKGKNPVSESRKWLQSFDAASAISGQHPKARLVSVGDREADFYELFSRVTPQDPDILVRAMHRRKLIDGDRTIQEHMDQLPASGAIDVHIPARGGRKARVARVKVSFDRVTLRQPVARRDLQPIKLWAVLVREDNPPPATQALEWLLLTTVRVETFEQACERVTWYTRRWGIEVFHRTFKNGACKTEDRQLGEAGRLAACLALDMVVAWRIYYMAKMGSVHPELPCTAFLEEDEWRVLVAHHTGDKAAKTPPTTREAIVMIAMLGGYKKRKGTSPGQTTIARGVAALSWMTMGWRMAVHGYDLQEYLAQLYGPG